MRHGDLEILERAQQHEEAHQGEQYYLGWEWTDVRAKPQTLNRLILEGLVDRRFKSNSSTSYRLTQEGQAVLEGNGQAAKIAGIADPQDLFGPIVGYDDIKDALRMVALEGRRVNVLLEGPPATAKSLFLMDLARLPGAYLATGSRVTAAGLTEALEQFRPPLLVMDEVDKTPHAVLSVLLSVMESGLVTVTKHGAHDAFHLECAVVGACNLSQGMPPEFRSRFGFHLRLKPYDEGEFLEVCRRLLSEREGLDEDLALEIGQATWDQLGRDVRTARSLARMLKEPTLEEVKRWTAFLKKYQ